MHWAARYCWPGSAPARRQGSQNRASRQSFSRWRAGAADLILEACRDSVIGDAVTSHLIASRPCVLVRQRQIHGWETSRLGVDGVGRRLRRLYDVPGTLRLCASTIGPDGQPTGGFMTRKGSVLGGMPGVPVYQSKPTLASPGPARAHAGRCRCADRSGAGGRSPLTVGGFAVRRFASLSNAADQRRAKPPAGTSMTDWGSPSEAEPPCT